ncbi:hypothetical protein D3C80_1826120 [compost metagenome]
MPIYHFLTIQYAQGVYIFGNRTFHTINQDYIPHVMQYAANTYVKGQIDNALAMGYITQQEYKDTIALMP